MKKYHARSGILCLILIRLVLPYEHETPQGIRVEVRGEHHSSHTTNEKDMSFSPVEEIPQSVEQSTQRDMKDCDDSIGGSESCDCSIRTLSDTRISCPEDGQCLVRERGKWRNRNCTGLPITLIVREAFPEDREVNVTSVVAITYRSFYIDVCVTPTVTITGGCNSNEIMIGVQCQFTEPLVGIVNATLSTANIGQLGGFGGCEWQCMSDTDFGALFMILQCGVVG